MFHKLLKWAIFSVLIALLPLMLKALYCVIHNDKCFEWQYLLGHGELFLISVGLSSRSVGEILSINASNRISRLICGGAGIIITILAAFVFADISAGWEASSGPKPLQSGQAVPAVPIAVVQLNPQGINAVSFTVFAASLVCGLCAIIISEEKK